LKVILIGAERVGKTALWHRYVINKFSNAYKSTIGADFLQKEIEVSGTDQPKLVTLQIWDTAGAERFKSLGNAFYRGSDICFLVYDVNSPESFSSLEALRLEFLQNVGSAENILFAVVGTKTDLGELPYKVSKQQVQDWCTSKEIMHIFEVSPKSSDGSGKINEMFLRMATLFLQRPNDSEIVFIPPPPPKQIEPESDSPFGFLKNLVDGIPNPITAFTDATSTNTTVLLDTTPTTGESPLSFFKNLIDSIPTPTFPTSTETETTTQETTNQTAETDSDPFGFFKRLINSAKTDEKPKTDN